jgi:hypothetical protein
MCLLLKVCNRCNIPSCIGNELFSERRLVQRHWPHGDKELLFLVGLEAILEKALRLLGEDIYMLSKKSMDHLYHRLIEKRQSGVCRHLSGSLAVNRC